MCGRFTLIDDLGSVAERFEAIFPGDLEYHPRYNIAPSQNILAVVNDGKNNRLGELRWGLIPSWAKDIKIGYKLINARTETLQEKPSFQSSFKRRRCIIPVDSFYEWKKKDGKKIPMRIQLQSHEIFSFAGLWDRWEQNDKVIHSCTIITTEPNSVMSDIHDRMPVILQSKKDEKAWLDRSIDDLDLLQQLLIPYSGEQMEAYEISDLVNSPKNDLPEVIKPVY
ncbi:SOS response-associated peptidase [Ectobacillus polymachus]|uniref:SOS response-associated peptidase n=1 Tax=Ectobacillus polymachus TaxID=1508806 RepID=UPI003A84E9DF